MAILCHLRRSAIVVCLACTLVGASWAAERAPWLADRAAAVQQARRQGKLLLIVQFSGDFALAADNSAEAALYRTFALSDPSVAKTLADRFVVAYEQVGSAESLRKLSPEKLQPKRPEYAFTYICLSDLRVVHFVPGFISAGELAAELKWAERCYAKVASAAADEELLATRQAHLAAIARSDLALFTRAHKSRWERDALPPGPSTFDLPAAVVAARETFEASLTQRLGKSWQRTAAGEAVPALAMHGGLTRELAHLLLAEFPLVSLADLERPAYEALTGERFWKVSHRREALKQWWSREMAAARPILLVVRDDPFAADANANSPLLWPPKTDALPLLSRFAVEVLSHDELAALASDAGLEPIVYRAVTPPRYVILPAGGKPAVTLWKGTSLSRLAQAMNAATGAGALAVTTAGGSSDEEM